MALELKENQKGEEFGEIAERCIKMQHKTIQLPHYTTDVIYTLQSCKNSTLISTTSRVAERLLEQNSTYVLGDGLYGLYLALSFLILSSHGMAPQKGACSSFLLSRPAQNSDQLSATTR